MEEKTCSASVDWDSSSECVKELAVTLKRINTKDMTEIGESINTEVAPNVVERPSSALSGLGDDIISMPHPLWLRELAGRLGRTMEMIKKTTGKGSAYGCSKPNYLKIQEVIGSMHLLSKEMEAATDTSMSAEEKRAGKCDFSMQVELKPQDARPVKSSGQPDSSKKKKARKDKQVERPRSEPQAPKGGADTSTGAKETSLAAPAPLSSAGRHPEWEAQKHAERQGAQRRWEGDWRLHCGAL